MKKILSIILSITMLFSIATIAFAGEVITSTATSEVEGVIKVGVNAEYAPFEYYDEEGKLTGFDIDLMNCIGERIGYDVKYVDMSFDMLVSAVSSGKVDCAISTFSVTDEREHYMDFTRPYLAANVTYKDGETVTEALEEYAIVFKDGVADSLYKSSMPTDYEKLFMLVNGTVEELVANGTIERLIDKYDLNKPYDEEADYEYGYYEYIALDAKENLEKPKFETWDEATTIPAPSEWAAKDIDFARAVGIIDANKDYLYKENITREEFCELIYNLVTLVKWEITAPVTDSFTDTKNDKILMLNGLGIINGKTATEFAPNDYLTREEAATIISRMIDKVMPSMFSTELYFEFNDADKISDWAMDSIQSVCNFGFMNGVGNGNFAPQDTYTTEQAIVTLARVYNSAEAAGIIDNASEDVIGGSDGATSIIVRDDADVIEKEEYDNFYANVSKNLVEVDDFYIYEAIKLIAESGELAKNRNFVSMYTANDEMTDKILAIGNIDFNSPTDIFYISANREQIIENINTMAKEADIDLAELEIFSFDYLWKKLNFSALASTINASYGAENLAALTILTNSRGYIMPKDFTENFALYFQYEGDYSALVSFSEYGDGVISAHMSFVKNGDKDNVFRRIYEITQGLGAGSINMAKVK